MTEVVEWEAERCVLWQARLQLHAWQHDPCRAHGEDVVEDSERFTSQFKFKFKILSVLSAHSLPLPLASGAHLKSFDRLPSVRLSVKGATD